MKDPRISKPFDVFSPSNVYFAPVFQRLYVWQERDWTSLLEEFEESTTDSPEFVGAIVLRDLGKTMGTVSPNAYLIIDGQQRLTTLYLMFGALSQVAREGGNEDMATYVLETFLALTRTPGFRGQPKLVPTLQDRYWMAQILRQIAPTHQWEWKAHPVPTEPPKSSRLMEQWERILAHCRLEMLTSAGLLQEERFQLWLARVEAGLRFIEIILDDADDANAIFSSLNAKGQPLALVDLVRNEVFHSLADQQARVAENFYREHWQPFEGSFADGTLGQFFPVYAHVRFEGQVTKARAFPALQQAWRDQDAASILADLSIYAPYFKALSGVPLPPEKRYDCIGRELRVRVERVSRMPRSLATWPFLMRLLYAVEESVVAEKTAIDVFDMLEAYLVRRLLVGIEPTGIQIIFKRMWSKTSTSLANGDARCILKPLEAASQDPPSDAELRLILENARSDKRAVLRFVLEEYERKLVVEGKGDPSPPRVETIEHVLPRNPKPDGWTTIPPDRRDGLVGLLGNLLPLSTQQNTALGNADWIDKRERFKGSNYKAVRLVAECQDWSEEAIRYRTEELVSWIVDRWRDPML